MRAILHTVWCNLSVVVLCICVCAGPTLSFGADKEGRQSEGAHLDCQYDDSGARGDSAVEHELFPSDDLFRPPLADTREPRFFAGYQFVEFDEALDEDDGDEVFNAAAVGFGETFGLWSMRQGQSCRGVQVSLLAGVYSRFNLDTPSANLLNSDFQVGLQTTARWGGLSARLRTYHQSSHLGDEFLLDNPDFDRLDLNMEVVELLVSIDADFVRVYGGGGYLVRTFPDSIARGKLQGGVELRSHPWAAGRLFETGTLRWVGGLDATSYEERDWGLTLNTRGGLELAGDETGRRIRANAVFATGYLPTGQFFRERTSTSVGVEAQFEF